MISYICRTYAIGNTGDFCSEHFNDRESTDCYAAEQSRRGKFSILLSTGHLINGRCSPDSYLCEYAAQSAC